MCTEDWVGGDMDSCADRTILLYSVDLLTDTRVSSHMFTDRKTTITGTSGSDTVAGECHGGSHSPWGAAVHSGKSVGGDDIVW